MKEKMRVGNLLAEFCVSLLKANPEHTSFWIENPDGSWFWRQPSILHAFASLRFHLFRIDYCRFGTPYRKRTRFATNLPMLQQDPILCSRDHAHTVLRGAHPSGVLWTQVAEPYPHPVADLLAVAAASQALWYPSPQFDIVALASRACNSIRSRKAAKLLKNASKAQARQRS